MENIICPCCKKERIWYVITNTVRICERNVRNVKKKDEGYMTTVKKEKPHEKDTQKNIKKKVKDTENKIKSILRK